MKRKCPETGEIYYALNEVFYKVEGAVTTGDETGA